MEKYKNTKTIRFRLIPEKISAINSQVECLRKTMSEGAAPHLTRFIQAGHDLSALLRQYIWYTDSDRLKPTVTIRYRWLRSFTRDLFYTWKKEGRGKKIKISDIGYLSPLLADTLREWDATLERLDAGPGRQEAALSIRKLASRPVYPFIRSFIENSNDKNTEETKNKLMVLAGELDTALKACETCFLPVQASGIVIAGASFNYYSVNKKTKDVEAEICKADGQLSARYPDFLLEQAGLPGFKGLSLSDLHARIKSYKAAQKAQFIKAVSNGLTYADLKSTFPLFQTDRDHYEEFLRITNRITQKSTVQSTFPRESPEAGKLQAEIEGLKKERGLYFKGNFRNYSKLCQFYKEVSIKKGMLDARKRGMEKERADAQKLQYWALILEERQEYYLILIPKDRACEVYKKIRASSGQDSSLYYFESMTYPALRKLCFGINGNALLPALQKELPRYNQREFGEFSFRKGASSQETGEARLVTFYQEVLKTDFVKNNLDLPHHALAALAGRPFGSLQDFKVALEKECYCKKQVLSAKLKKEILEQYDAQIFRITSLDLQKGEKKNLKAHTTIWQQFWTRENEVQQYNLRLNPEIAVSWRAVTGDPAWHDPVKKNRYSQEQYTLHTTITDNALHNETVYAAEDAIRQFNGDIDAGLKEQFTNNALWFYGIDTGETGSATLALIDKNMKPRLFTVYECRRPDFAKQGYVYNADKELVIRDKPYTAIQNLSYFLSRELYEKTFRDGLFQETFTELFEKKHTAALDLATAKVINGNIVTNGDITTLLNLTILNAQRAIYQAPPGAELKEKGQTLYFDDGNKTVYRHRKIFEYIRPYQQVRDYLFSDRPGPQANNITGLEEKICQTRRALVGNITGVIYSLYKQYPGIISIKDSRPGKVGTGRMKCEENIGRFLEWSLYRKLQSDGAVPPIRELGKARETEEYLQGSGNKTPKQFGILQFVNGNDAGSACPNCNDTGSNRHGREEGEFFCEKCGFHNKTNPMGYESLDSRDKITAFNIARKGLFLHIDSPAISCAL